jgi:hypothetical protein
MSELFKMPTDLIHRIGILATLSVLDLGMAK